ncbi:MAG: response regulator [Crocinitomicaceae bacterium]|nr:response regulator [Flavobacteriales bacterium]NQZ38397.1 response regulator [Crocinitomicaceae bacterium]PHR30753.1 MAG: DNA-binding response regulator [Fluviicola sp.]
MIKVLIIDDEPLARSIVRSFLQEKDGYEIVGECANGYEGLKSIDALKPDLVFLDIQMPKINGFEMLELVDDPISVIFTTAFDEYALKAFETSAVDYLLKPFSEERFDQALAKWKNTQKTEPTKAFGEISKQPDDHLRIVIKDGSSIKIIPIQDVIYLEAYDDYVKVHTSEKTYLKKKTLTYYEKTLNKRQFVRIHRSYVLNINELTGIEPFEKNSYRAVLKNNKRIPISRTAYGPLKESLGV